MLDPTLTDAEADDIKAYVPVNPDGDEVTELKYSKLEREVYRTNKRDPYGSERETAEFKASDLENLLKAVIPDLLAKQLAETKNELVSEMKEAMMEEIKGLKSSIAEVEGAQAELGHRVTELEKEMKKRE